MCTVTIRLSQDDLLVTMNRDEQKKRPDERSPFYWEHEKIIAPQDSLRHGTWMAVNDRGHVACLLNGYKNVTQKNNSFSHSRGEIIPTVLSSDDPYLTALNMTSHIYDSFRLILVKDNTVSLHEWDLEKYNSILLPSRDWLFFTSSSWKQDIVKGDRNNQFEAWRNEGCAFNDKIPGIHTRYCPKQPAFSPLMERDDAQTKSITQYSSNLMERSVRYWPVLDHQPDMNRKVEIPVLV